MSEARIACTPRPNATPETEISLLAAIYAMALLKHCQKQKSVRCAPTPDDRDGSMKFRTQSKEAIVT